jgi:DeoR/GlpR family transcriptional regulator of sugar metabolism
VVTNAINIATELAAQESSLAVIVIGGVMRAEELSLLGHIAESSLPEVRVNKIFMGAQALSLEGGWTTDHLPEVATCRRILDMSSELVVLADHSTLGHTAPALITPFSRLHALVTDAMADPGFIRQARARGVRVLIAGEEQAGVTSS